MRSVVVPENQREGALVYQTTDFPYPPFMSPRFAVVLLLVTGCLATAGCRANAAPPPNVADAASTVHPVAVGDRAPDFRLEGSDGKMHALADHAGKQAVVLAWFPKAFTGG